ncbi:MULTISPECIES: cytochrome P450 [Methylosinus]|uniref:Cytochrome P450 n=1 Tax=Methylosinus trichosporium (strain ATCC 35070 / NCIMB 11131 / UNIQEM 75 / OB3b) TaxID=595536 RepID=A0A2D2D3M9_METT3|nr:MULTISPECIES: cytochrome P450 [Methylosinus]ATQ69587.1 cytochrome P450 [Methylosinus trichosporium OB3b]OBS54332.1 cytochrome P450 [Methylosinus sp. 3S-1]
MFHDPDLMPFTPRARPSLRVAAFNQIENWPAETYREAHATMRGVFPLLAPTLLIADPTLIEEALVARAEAFERDRFQTRALTNDVNRASLFFAEGADWRWQRRAAAPAFRHDNLLALVPTFARCGADLAKEWRRANDGAVRDVAPEMSRLTFDIILRAVLGAGATRLDERRFLEALAPSLASVGWRFLYARIGLPEAVPYPGSRRVARSIAWLHDATKELIAHRRQEAGESKDILALLLSAQDPETGRVMSDDELLSNLYTFMVAGHETSATTLAWALWLIAKDQATQERLRAEVSAVVGAREIGAQDIEKLGFARQVLNEAMRLFPPAIGVGRAPREDMTLGPLRLRAGQLLIVASFCVHRHEKLWDEPHGFDPERFSPERAKARHRCAFLPFGAGPRICIGMNFAMIEMIVLLASLVRDFRFHTTPGHRMMLGTNLTLRSRTGLPLAITPL